MRTGVSCHFTGYCADASKSETAKRLADRTWHRAHRDQEHHEFSEANFVGSVITSEPDPMGGRDHNYQWFGYNTLLASTDTARLDMINSRPFPMQPRLGVWSSDEP